MEILRHQMAKVAAENQNLRSEVSELREILSVDDDKKDDEKKADDDDLINELLESSDDEVMILAVGGPADIACFGKYFKDAEKFKIKRGTIFPNTLF